MIRPYVMPESSGESFDADEVSTQYSYDPDNLWSVPEGHMVVLTSTHDAMKSQLEQLTTQLLEKQHEIDMLKLELQLQSCSLG